MSRNNLTFTAVSASDQLLIQSWFNQAHVQEFYYGDGLQNTLNNLELFCQGKNDNGHYQFFHWLAHCNDTPFGFLMTSPISGPHDANSPYNKHYAAGQSIFTLDLLIGEVSHLGKGLAVPMIQQFIISQYGDADTILIDPETANKRAIHVYQKAGFTPVETFTPDFNPKPHLMLTLDVHQLKQQNHA